MDRSNMTDAERAMLEALDSSPPDFHRMVGIVQNSDPSVLRVRDSAAQRTPLHIAAMYNKVAYTAMLLSRGAEIEARDVWLWTPLMSAAFGVANGAGPDTAELLISYGADVNAKCIKGTNALHVCAAYGSIDLMDQLIVQGGDSSLADNMGETPLHKAALRGDLDIVRLLVERNADARSADVSARSMYGYTPAQLASMEVSHQHDQVVAYLQNLSA
jgi:ankyrin repeat protein